MKLVIVLLAAVALTGCSSVADVVKAMAKDPASVCATVTTIYGTAKVYRTAIRNGSVNCNQDGMVVTAGDEKEK